MLEVAKQQVCMSVSCTLHTFLKYRVHYTIVAAPTQCCNYVYASLNSPFVPVALIFADLIFNSAS